MLYQLQSAIYIQALVFRPAHQILRSIAIGHTSIIIPCSGRDLPTSQILQQHLIQEADFYRLGDVVIHARSQTHLLVTGHGVGRHGNHR